MRHQRTLTQAVVGTGVPPHPSAQNKMTPKLLGEEAFKNTS
jgi:hypothetical protein